MCIPGYKTIDCAHNVAVMVGAFVTVSHNFSDFGTLPADWEITNVT